MTVIYYHGNILTGVGLDQANPQRVTAIAVGRNSIVAIGDDASVLRKKQPGTRLIDLQGAFVMPGFNDAHVHLAYAGQNKLAVDLTGCTSLADMLNRVSAAAGRALPGQWLLGGGWDHTLWTDQRLPTRQDLDSVSRGHPAIFHSRGRAYCGRQFSGSRSGRGDQPNPQPGRAASLTTIPNTISPASCGRTGR